MLLRYFQCGFHFSQDGPGNRLIYHLQGCNLRCPWCSNPEGMGARCDATVEAPVEDVARAVLSARPMFFDGGGLTLTGGEATCQFDAVRALLQMVHDQGVHTAIETNLTSPRWAELLPLLDYVIADVKHPVLETLRRATGWGEPLLFDNLRLAVDSGKPVLVRFPLIHGFNDDDETRAAFIERLSPIAALGALSVEILPYHEYGKDKWVAQNKPYLMENAFVSPACVANYEAAFRDAGLTVVRT